MIRGDFVGKEYEEKDTYSGVWCLKQNPDKASIVVNAHYHKDIELLYLTGEDMIVWVNDKSYYVETGDLFVVRPRETHAITATGRSKHLVIKFMPSIFRYEGQSPKELSYLRPFTEDVSDFDRHIKKETVSELGLDKIFVDIFEQDEKKNFGYELDMRVKLLKLILKLARYFNKENNLVEHELPDRSVFKIRSAAEILIRDFPKADEKEVAKELQMSSGHFSRLFKKVMGMSFSDYATSLRINKARSYLLTTQMSITEIAFETGYSSASHFIRVFKQRFGKTPTEYKRDFENNFK